MSIERRIEDSKDELLEELVKFLRMPSVSTRSTGDERSFRGCAEWVHVWLTRRLRRRSGPLQNARRAAHVVYR